MRRKETQESTELLGGAARPRPPTSTCRTCQHPQLTSKGPSHIPSFPHPTSTWTPHHQALLIGEESHVPGLPPSVTVPRHATGRFRCPNALVASEGDTGRSQGPAPPVGPLPSHCPRTDRPEERPTSSKCRTRLSGLVEGREAAELPRQESPSRRQNTVSGGALGLGSHTWEAKITEDVRPRRTRSHLPSGERGRGTLPP